MDGILDFPATSNAPIAFLFARDVPVPSFGSKYELKAAWNLIRWRNSIKLGSPTIEGTVWSEVFRDINRYSPGFLESCLCHFRTWTNVLWNMPLRHYDYSVIFDSIVAQALHRDLTTGEAVALARAFAGYLTGSAGYRIAETVDKTNIIPQPFSYILAVGSSESTRTTHLAITHLVVRAARSSVGTGLMQWAKWITLMLWISIPKDPGYLAALHSDSIGHNETPNIWDEIEMSSTSVVIEGPHIEEIAKILWQTDNNVTENLSRDAFKDPLSLASDAFSS
jgi:hypothetical protein